MLAQTCDFICRVVSDDFSCKLQKTMACIGLYDKDIISAGKAQGQAGSRKCWFMNPVRFWGHRPFRALYSCSVWSQVGCTDSLRTYPTWQHPGEEWDHCFQHVLPRRCPRLSCYPFWNHSRASDGLYIERSTFILAKRIKPPKWGYWVSSLKAERIAVQFIPRLPYGDVAPVYPSVGMNGKEGVPNSCSRVIRRPTVLHFAFLGCVNEAWHGCACALSRKDDQGSGENGRFKKCRTETVGGQDVFVFWGQTEAFKWLSCFMTLSVPFYSTVKNRELGLAVRRLPYLPETF